MQQVTAPDQKPMRLNQGQYGSLGYYGHLELKQTPEDGQIGPFGDLWRQWGSNLEVTVCPCSCLGGAPDQKVFIVRFFFPFA